MTSLLDAYDWYVADCPYCGFRAVGMDDGRIEQWADTHTDTKSHPVTVDRL